MMRGGRSCFVRRYKPSDHLGSQTLLKLVDTVSDGAEDSRSSSMIDPELLEQRVRNSGLESTTP
jgi:hypothetical protein